LQQAQQLPLPQQALQPFTQQAAQLSAHLGQPQQPSVLVVLEINGTKKTAVKSNLVNMVNPCLDQKSFSIGRRTRAQHAFAIKSHE
jgi:hypothetical protein